MNVRRALAILLAATLATAALGIAPAAAIDTLPYIVSVTPSTASATLGTPVTLSVDANGGALAYVDSIEMRVDNGPWVPMAPQDGTWGDGAETGTGTLASTATSVAAGSFHACALIGDGTVRCWGDNTYGQLGNGGAASGGSAVAVHGITGATAISAGSTHTCALLANGTVSCWGGNSSGQLGNGTTTVGKVPTTVPGITTATAIGAGFSHTCAIIADDTVNCWGSNIVAQLGDGTIGNVRTSPVAASGVSTAKSVAAGGVQTCATLADLSAVCWGNNNVGALGDGTTTSTLGLATVASVTDFVALEAGNSYTCAIDTLQTAWCWGYNLHGQLGDGTGTTRLAPNEVSKLGPALQISAGTNHTCAIGSGGDLHCWGDNGHGQLGDSTVIDHAFQALVPGITASSVSAGSDFTCAVHADGRVYCWGDNSHSQLGNGTTTESWSPVAVAGVGQQLTLGVHQVCAREWNTDGVVTDGTSCTTVEITDGTAPSFTVPLTVALRSGVRLATASATAPVPVTLSWVIWEEDTGVASIVVERSTDGGTTWTTVATPPPNANSINTGFQNNGIPFQFRVSARDGADNLAQSTTPPLQARIVQQSAASVTWKGTWTTASSAAFSGGTAKSSVVKGSTVTFAFTGSSVAFVATRAPGRGVAWIYVDNVLKAKVSLAAATTQARTIVWRHAFAASGPHRVKVLVSGTARIDADAFITLK